MNILNDIKNIQKKISNFYLKDITYKTNKKFNVKFEVNSLKETIYCNKEEHMDFLYNNLGILGLIDPFKLIELISLYHHENRIVKKFFYLKSMKKNY